MTAVVEAPTWNAFPRWRTGDRALYVIEIGHDRIKVGIGYSPAARLQSHRSTARAHGVTSGRAWATPRCLGSEAENALIGFCAARATEQFRREYFSGVPFEDAVQCAAELTGYTRQTLRLRAAMSSPNAKYSIANVAELLATTEEAVYALVASNELEVRDPDEEPPVIKRRALLNWFDTEPHLLSIPRGAAS
jgi:hypothetical protein